MTGRTFVPGWRTVPLAVQVVGPVALPLLALLLVLLTWASLSETVPARVRELLPVLEMTEVIVTVGGGVSGRATPPPGSVVGAFEVASRIPARTGHATRSAPTATIEARNPRPAANLAIG